MRALAKPISVMLVDDHPVVREGLKGMLEYTSDFEVVGEATDGVEAVATAERLKPDVIIMDVLMPRQDGIDACRKIMEKLPATRVLMLTVSTEKDAVIEAVAAGAMGYLQKYTGGEELEESLRALAEGRLKIPDEALSRTLAMVRGDLWERTHRASGALTTREQELLALFASGDSYARIAEVKGISPVTVRNTIARVQEKLELDSKAKLVIWAVKKGLVQEPEPGD